MGRAPDQRLEAIRAALGDLAAQDVPELIAQARAEAQNRVRELLADVMTEVMLERARTGLEAPSSPEPSPPAGEGELGFYVYCIVHADALPAMPEQPGIDIGHPPTLLAHDDLAAVVSRVPLSDFGEERLRERLADMEWLEGTARRHEGVLEAIGEDATLIPMRLCTIYRGEDGVREMLIRERAALEEALAHLEHKTEWGVKVFARESERESEPASALGEDTPPADGTAYMQRRRDVRDRREHRAQQHHDACVAIHDALAAVAADAITSPPQRAEVSGHSGEMLLNGVYLVEDGELSRFLNEVEALKEQYQEQGLELEPTGPWPAYNFVPGTIGAAW